MTPKRGLQPMLSLAVLFAVFVVGCAASQSVTLPGPAAVDARQRLMKSMGANWAEAQAKFKAGNVEGWDQGMKFNDTAKASAALAVQLRDTARGKNASATEAIMKDFGAKACGACHTPFRQPAR
ncbi:MAG: hypothetical protein H6Q86_5827 [candidate division NC10 bacterium]|nr:hypothetical protein [candidate division NC10 bacterium]